MYAVVSSGGKQYRVEAGSELVVERLTAEPGASITFDRVLLVGDGEAVTIGSPVVKGATVSATVLGEQLGPKLVIFKFKQKATYRRKRGHRQHLTRVRIDEISADGKRSAAPKADEADASATKPARKTPTTAAAKPKAAGKAKAPVKAKPAAKAKTATRADAADKPKARRVPAKKKAESKE